MTPLENEEIKTLDISAEDLDTYFPHVSDGDVIRIAGSNNGRDGLYRIKVAEEKVH